MKPIYELTFKMRELRHLLGDPTASEFAERHKITEELLQKLETDTWLQLSRPDLVTLLTLAESVSTKDKRFELLVTRPHPLWSTFTEDGPTLLFRPRDDKAQEYDWAHALSAELMRRTKLQATDAHVFARGKPDVGALIRCHNTILLGSPKYNVSTEEAICQIVGRATPFDPSDANRRRLPFQFYFDNWTDVAGNRTSAICDQATVDRPAGISIEVGPDKVRHLPLTARHGPSPSGWDIGLLIARRFKVPNAPSAYVTTIVVAGHSSFSASMVVKDITSGDVYIGDALDNERTVLRFLLCGWRRGGPSHEPAFEPVTRARRWFAPGEAREMAELLKTSVESKRHRRDPPHAD